MSIEPNVEEQELLEDTFGRASSRLTTRERLWAMVSAVVLIAAIAALWSIDRPGSFALAPAISCVLVLALSANVRFDTPLGYAPTTQLAFVPLLFVVPSALLPIAVVSAFVLGLVPGLFSGRVRPDRVALQASNSLFSVGPAAVLAIAHVTAWDAGPALLIAALASQFVVDFGVSATAFALIRGASLLAQLRESWVYAVDAALTPPALIAGETIHHTPVAALALVPLLGLLAVFARERHKRLESMLELSNAYRGTALVLGDVIEADDGYTGEHCKSVVSLATEVAKRLGLSPERRRNLEFAALLHDVGKIAIPKEIINKPGKLDDREWMIIKTHTIEGQKLLDTVGGFMREVGLIVRSHHERWDGGGYPDGLAGEEIPLESRIVSCCDTWNAMRTDRSYRQHLPFNLAAEEMRAVAGTQLDPRVVAALLDVVADESLAEELEVESGAAAPSTPAAEAVTQDVALAPAATPEPQAHT